MKTLSNFKFPETNPCGAFFNEVVFIGNIYGKYSNYDPMRRRWLTNSSLLVGHNNHRDEMLICFTNQTVKDVAYATSDTSTVNEMILFINHHFTLIQNPSYPMSSFLESGESLYEGLFDDKEVSLTIKKRGASTLIKLILYQLKL